MASIPRTREANPQKPGKPSLTKLGSGSTKRGQGADDEGWGGFTNYMAAKKHKLSEQFDEYSDKKSDIFQGLAIYINGYTKPSSDELRTMITAHGGKNEMYLSKTRVTHIVATNLPNSKFHLAKSMPVVKPEWITDSIAACRCLPHTSYLTISNKSKLQAGLKSLPSMSSLSRTSSTRALNQNDSTGSNGSLSKQDPYNTTKYSEENKNHMKTNDLPTKSNVNNKDNNEIHISSENLISKNIEVLDNDGNNKHQDCCENRVKNDIENINEDFDSGTELDPDIVYNSEDESTPQRLQLNFSRLTKKARAVHSPGNILFPDFRIGKNNTSTPKVKQFLHHQHPTELLSKDIVSKTCSPIKEQENEEETEINSVLTAIDPPSNVISSSKPSMAKAGDKGFLNEFYSNSRLHHIATWGAEFKAYVSDIQQKGDASFPRRKQLREAVVENASRLRMMETLESSRHCVVERTVMHVDMDCFFVSVGLLSRPELKGKPVAVTHSRGQGAKPDPRSDAELERQLWNLKKDKGLKTRSSCEKPDRPLYDLAVPEGSTGFKTFNSMAEIASCSYEARKKGVKNGMFMGKAKTLCADLLTIPYDFDEYNKISRILYDIVASFTHDIEAVSCDEMFVDCTDVLSDTGATAIDFASLLRKEVFNKTGCTASVGIGPNILLARLATKKAKPNGVFQVFKQEAKAFIRDQNVSDLPGVGYSMSNKLSRLGVTTCGDLQLVPASTLRREFGPKTGASLHNYSLGVDDREVKGNKQRKSVSAEVNYGIRFTQELDAFKFLKELSGEVAKRLDGLGVKGRSITLKLMVKRPDAPAESAKFMGHGICNTITKSSILPMATSDANQIGQEVVSIYRQHKISAPDVRGIGIQVQRLENASGRMGQQSHIHTSHQSILQFAVNRNAKPSSPSTDTCYGPTIQSRRLVSSNDHVRNSCDQRKSDSYKTDPSLPPNKLQPRASDTGQEYSLMRDVSFLLSPSQVNESVLEELPAEIAQEIRVGIDRHNKEKDWRSLPHTNTTSDMTSLPVTSSNQSGSFINKVASCSSSSCGSALHPSTSSSKQCSNSINENDLPSESQIDMSCFHALPRSLQKELEEAYAKQKEHTTSKMDGLLSDIGHETQSRTVDQSKPISDPSCHVSEIPMLCRVESAMPGPSTSSGVHIDVTDVDELPSQSQIDMSCFHALPRSLQKELEDAYAKQKQANKMEDKRSSPVKGTAFEKLKSPTKDKGKQLKKKRGRRPGSKKQLNLGNNMTRLKSLGTKLHQQRDNLKTRYVTESRLLTDGAICLDEDSQSGCDSREAIDRQDMMVPSYVNQPKVEFCGASSVKDVRCLYKEWIQSCTEPGDSDVAMVTDHLTSLIHHKCLEQAFCLLRFLRRYVQISSKSVAWQTCTETIAVLVQSVVLEVYGTELKLFA